MNRSIIKRVLLVTLAGILSACSTMPEDLVSSPRVNLKNVQVVGLGFQGQTFLLSFDVANPNPFPLPIRSIDYGVKLDGQRFASGQTVSDFTVPASGDSTFAISVELDLLQTSPQLLNLARVGARREVRYELAGRFGVDIPLAPSIKYRNSGTIRLD
jgi:LEA14-like dessication related protein